MWCHAELHVENLIPCTNIKLYVTTYGYWISPCISLHDLRLSCGSMLHNPREQLLTQQVTIHIVSLVSA